MKWITCWTRDAAAETARLFDQCGLAYALAAALTAAGPRPPITLAGRDTGRNTTTVGDLRLAASLGAHPWRAASGYEGLTVLLWDRDGKRLSSPLDGQPAGRHAPASAPPTPIAANRRGPAAARGGGLPTRPLRIHPALEPSSTRSDAFPRPQKSSVADLAHGPDPAADRLRRPGCLRRLARAAHAYALAQYPIGLAERNPLDRIVVLRPSAWADRFFDEMRQRAGLAATRRGGERRRPALPWAGVNEDAVEFLEAVNPARDEAERRPWCGHPASGGAAANVTVEPLSLLSRGGAARPSAC